MTRTEVKKQIKSGWVNSLSAIGFLNVDLLTLDNLVKRRTLATKMNRGTTLYKIDDILAISKVSVKEFLEKNWPVDRRKKPTRFQQVNVFKTQKERNRFLSRWFRAFDHITSLIGTPKAETRVGELKLFHQLMALSKRVNSFDLVPTTKQLLAATGLDDEALPMARRSLIERNIIKVDISGTPWMYTLLDPRTGQPFKDDATDDDDIPFKPFDSWADFDPVDHAGAFQKTRWQSDAQGNIVRELLDINVSEISPVTWAAYLAPHVDVRSAPADIRKKLKQDDDLDDDDDSDEDIGDNDDDDDDDDSEDEEDRCECRCERCVMSDCSNCYNTTCDDSSCLDAECAMQQRALQMDLIIRRMVS